MAGAIVSDVGSVKGSVLRDMAPHLPANVHFIPAHPVAGTENSGPDAGFAELFVNRWCILTPPPNADAAAVERLASFWRALGANVESMPADHHDLVLGITSHLPHLIAYTIVGTADELCEVTRSEVLKFSAGGFRDFTRIAASDPTMWRDVFLANKDAVLEMLGRFNEDLSALTRAMRTRRRPDAVRSFHPHPRHPPRHRRDRPGFAGAGFRPRASGPAGRAAAAALCGRQRIGRSTADRQPSMLFARGLLLAPWPAARMVARIANAGRPDTSWPPRDIPGSWRNVQFLVKGSNSVHHG